MTLAVTLSSSICASLVGCSGGSSGSDESNVQVAQVAIPASPGGEVSVQFSIIGDILQFVQATLYYSLDGGATWAVATLPDDVDLSGLAASPTGVIHDLVWDSLADIGVSAGQTVTLSFTLGGLPPAFGTQVTLELDNRHKASDRVESYLFTYGAFDDDAVALAEKHDLVILDPSHPTVTRSIVERIQDGVNATDPADDVLVLGYLNIGEDVRTGSLTDGDLLLDPRFVGDGSGPRIDPRGPAADGDSLADLPLTGSPAVSNGYASFYLDDNSVDADGTGDGLPDRNGYTGAAFVNMGDPAWDTTLHEMTRATDGVAGINESLTLTTGEGLGLDGLLLDNIDTAAPNSYTGPGDLDQSEFEWTAPGYADLLDRLRVAWPDHVLAQNRGLFFFDPRLAQYEFTTLEPIDFLMFESYRLDADGAQEFDSFFFADNKHNFAPKLMAEGARGRGFQVLSLGYAEGPGIEHGTLLGTDTGGLTTLLEDIEEAQNQAGFRHYLTDADALVMNSFVVDNSAGVDTDAPVWTSTYNINPPFPSLPTAPVARVGIQAAVPGYRSMTVRWDVAMDASHVEYVLYLARSAFDFSRPLEDQGEAIKLDADVGLFYELGPDANTYPYQASVGGLNRDTIYWMVIRAVDSAGNEDTNQVELNARTFSADIDITIDGSVTDWNSVPRMYRDRNDAPRSAGPDWRDIRMFNDEDTLYIYGTSQDAYTLDGSPSFSDSQTRIHIDIDGNPFTGAMFHSIGAELVIVGNELRSADGTVLQQIPALPLTFSTKRVEWSLPLSIIDEMFGGVAQELTLIFENTDAGDLAPDSGNLTYRILR